MASSFAVRSIASLPSATPAPSAPWSRPKAPSPKPKSETTAYEEKLRAAKAEIFQARDQKMKQWNAEREAALEQVRQHTRERVRAARQDIEQSAHDARLQIVAASEDLSARVLKAVLPAGIRTTEEVAQ